MVTGGISIGAGVAAAGAAAGVAAGAAAVSVVAVFSPPQAVSSASVHASASVLHLLMFICIPLSLLVNFSSDSRVGETTGSPPIFT
jgi:hypothetical protein